MNGLINQINAVLGRDWDNECKLAVIAAYVHAYELGFHEAFEEVYPAGNGLREALRGW